MKAMSFMGDKGPYKAKLRVGPIPVNPAAEGFTIHKDPSDYYF
jgi:hypothetical protein